jgi:hypothetical protein
VSRATRSQVSTKGLRDVGNLSEAEVDVQYIVGEERSVTPAGKLWWLVSVESVR